MIKVNPEEFQLWSNLIFQYTGIVIGEGKSYLIENRLYELALETGCRTFSELYYKCRYGKDEGLRKKVVDRISTQETSFFRDRNVYDALKTLIRDEIIPAKRTKPNLMGRPGLRIWSAACSTGQEPYSLGMLLSENLTDLENWDIYILASDLSDSAFKKASLGRYTQLEVARGLENYYLKKYFTARPDNLWQINDRIRSMISFRKINLVSEDFRQFGAFDLILCRNVAIYFDAGTKMGLFKKMSEVLHPKGFLVLGATESLSQIETGFKQTQKQSCFFYVKNNRGPRG